jgi:hypothetical protein
MAEKIKRVMGNIDKYLSYREAWSRINNPKASCFEVVMLCESIISDRILSYVLAPIHKVRSNANCRTSFAKLIEEWRRLAGNTLLQRDRSDLGSEVDAWRQERNAIVHGLVKSYPGTPTVPVSSFLERAKCTANKGTDLATFVSNWQKRQKRRAAPRQRSAAQQRMLRPKRNPG